MSIKEATGQELHFKTWLDSPCSMLKFRLSAERPAAWTMERLGFLRVAKIHHISIQKALTFSITVLSEI
jgi:hypothetical protein